MSQSHNYGPVGINSPHHLAEQRAQDVRQAVADKEAMERDRRQSELLRDEIAQNWDHAVAECVRKALLLFADPRRGDDVQRNRALDRLRGDLADAKELLWP